MNTPSLGRIVHYAAPRYTIMPHEGGQPTEVEVLPAIITKVHSPELINVVVFGGAENGQELTSVRFGDGEPRTWFWPPRV